MAPLYQYPIKHPLIEQYDVSTEKLMLITQNKAFHIEEFTTTPLLVLTKDVDTAPN